MGEGAVGRISITELGAAGLPGDGNSQRGKARGDSGVSSSPRLSRYVPFSWVPKVSGELGDALVAAPGGERGAEPRVRPGWGRRDPRKGRTAGPHPRCREHRKHLSSWRDSSFVNCFCVRSWKYPRWEMSV